MLPRVGVTCEPCSVVLWMNASRRDAVHAEGLLPLQICLLACCLMLFFSYQIPPKSWRWLAIITVQCNTLAEIDHALFSLIFVIHHPWVYAVYYSAFHSYVLYSP
jgi:hypothetical protein